MHTVHNARIQLLATLLNDAALAFIVAGFIALATGGQLHGGWQVVTTHRARLRAAWRGE